MKPLAQCEFNIRRGRISITNGPHKYEKTLLEIGLYVDTREGVSQDRFFLTIQRALQLDDTEAMGLLCDLRVWGLDKPLKLVGYECRGMQSGDFDV